MRSRNGNCSLLCAICALILVLPLCGDEYIISYRVVKQQAALLNEHLYVSRAMTPCHGSEAGAVFLESGGSDELNTVLQNNFDLFFEYISSFGLHLRSFSNSYNQIIDDKQILTLKPQCFTVDFNDGLAKISALK